MSQTRIDLAIGGMTCATCAGRVERKLNRIAGVTATVNFATETAHVTYPTDVTVEALVATVEATGYSAAPPTVATEPDAASLAGRLITSAILTAPVLLLAMLPALRFPGWSWVALALAAPVVTWGALPFHRAAWVNARHGSATMDTLISLGTAVSALWSVYVLLFTSSTDTYLEVGATVTTFLLAGRYIEGRAKRRSGSALRALLALGAKDASVLRQGREVRVPVAELVVDDLFVVRPGERVPTDGEIVAGRSAIDTSMITGESMPVDVAPGDTVIGATTNAGGLLTVRATRVGSRTQLAQMARLVGRCPVGQGGGATARRPDLVGIRTRRHRSVDRGFGGLAAQRPQRRVRRSPRRWPC